MPHLEWSAPGRVCARFFAAEAFVKGIRGPVGSGKSVACCVYLMSKAAQQEPSPGDKIRRTRFAIVRNTNPQLKTTTIKTWLSWMPEGQFGKFNWSVPYTHHVKIDDLDAEFIFLSLDRPDDVRKLLSMDLTGVWVNEAREVHKDIIDGCTMRVGRYPPMNLGGPTWYGVIMDTNSPDDDHWWPIMAGDVPLPEHLSEEEAVMLVKPDNWMFFNQPPAMTEERDGDNNLLGYRINPRSENLPNLPPEYYPNIIRGKRKNWIDVYVRNQIGAVFAGKPVYERSFNKDVHVAPSAIEYLPHLPIRVGVDFGRTPAAVVAQQLEDGRWQILRELCTRGMGAKRFARILKTVLRNMVSHTGKPLEDLDIIAWGDPRGDDATQSDDSTPITMMRTHAGFSCWPAPSNDPVVRIEAVENVLDKMIGGRPCLVIDPMCRVLIRGFENGYHYELVTRQGEGSTYEPNPRKNRYSHPHDALQYLLLGEGEGYTVLHGRERGAVVPVVSRLSPRGYRELSQRRIRPHQPFRRRRGSSV